MSMKVFGKKSIFEKKEGLSMSGRAENHRQSLQ